jgi:hypothetical protein
MKYDTKKRDDNANFFMKAIEEQTTLEGLYDLVQKTPEQNERSYIGHRVRQCNRAFVEKLTELAKSDFEILLGIMTIRKSWGSQNNHVSYNEYFSDHSGNIFWHIAPYLKEQIGLENVVRLSKPRYRDDDYHAKHEEYDRWLEVTRTEQKKTVERYSCYICKDREVSNAAVLKLVSTLKTYETCKLVYVGSCNGDVGTVLLRKMSKHAKTAEQNLYCINAIFNRRDGIEELRDELKIVTDKFQKFV